MPWSELFSLLWVLVCVLCIIGLAYWFTRYVVGRAAAGRTLNGAGRIEVLTRTAVGRDQQLLLVRAGGRTFLLGATGSGITCLAEFTAEEAAALSGTDGEAGEQPPGFKEALQKVIQQKMKR